MAMAQACSGIAGAGLRGVGSLTPLLTADGTAGIAWADNNDDEGDGRLHLALEGVPGVAVPAQPDVRLAGPTRRVLAADADLGLTIRCSAACDVHVQLGKGLLAPSANVSLTRAGEKQVKLSLRAGQLGGRAGEVLQAVVNGISESQNSK